MSKESSGTGAWGITFLDALGIAFIVLKLTGVIDWSWWWVLAPIWIPAAVVIGLMLIALPFVAVSRRKF